MVNDTKSVRQFIIAYGKVFFVHFFDHIKEMLYLYLEVFDVEKSEITQYLIDYINYVKELENRVKCLNYDYFNGDIEYFNLNDFVSKYKIDVIYCAKKTFTQSDKCDNCKNKCILQKGISAFNEYTVCDEFYDHVKYEVNSLGVALVLSDRVITRSGEIIYLKDICKSFDNNPSYFYFYDECECRKCVEYLNGGNCNE